MGCFWGRRDDVRVLFMRFWRCHGTCQLERICGEFCVGISSRFQRLLERFLLSAIVYSRLWICCGKYNRGMRFPIFVFFIRRSSSAKALARQAALGVFETCSVVGQRRTAMAALLDALGGLRCWRMGAQREDDHPCCADAAGQPCGQETETVFQCKWCGERGAYCSRKLGRLKTVFFLFSQG